MFFFVTEDLKIAYSELHYSAQYGAWNDDGKCAIRSEEDQRQKDDYAALLNVEWSEAENEWI